jgi:MinD superfamily P-loop ATPase
MIISVLSGKGGTGKTTVAVNLAVSLAGKGEKVLLLDADVEEPNAWLYLKPAFDESLPVSIPVPEINEELCDYCGKCADFCEYNALAVAQGTVLTFLELCHACGGCTLVCPRDAIKEVDREIGILEKGKADFIDFWPGKGLYKDTLAQPSSSRIPFQGQ